MDLKLTFSQDSLRPNRQLPHSNSHIALSFYEVTQTLQANQQKLDTLAQELHIFNKPSVLTDSDITKETAKQLQSLHRSQWQSSQARLTEGISQIRKSLRQLQDTFQVTPRFCRESEYQQLQRQEKLCQQCALLLQGLALTFE